MLVAFHVVCCEVEILLFLVFCYWILKEDPGRQVSCACQSRGVVKRAEVEAAPRG